MTAALKAEARHHARAAQHLLAEKGSSGWTANDQHRFDQHIDAAERAQLQIDAVLEALGDDSVAAARHAEGVEIYLRQGLSNLDAGQMQKIQAAMSTTTPAEGGYTVSTLVADKLLSYVKGYGWMRQVASQQDTTTGGAMGFPTSDGTAETGELLAQNAAASLLDPSFASVSIPTYRFSSKVFTVPIELLQDTSVDLLAFIAARMRERIGRTQNAFFTTGTGSSQPQGIVTASAAGKVGTTGQTATIIYDDLVDLADSVDEGHLGQPSRQSDLPTPTAGWMMSQAMRKVVRKLKDTNGRPIWLPGDGVNPAQLLDYPVYINNDMAAPAASAKSLIFGNLGNYLIRDALEVRLLRMDDSAFALKGQVGFIAYARAGGALREPNAVKHYQHSAT